ncbi:hypothetical protein HGRIS_005815 [Hohenbuehelia grisea]|uniref:Gelsolin-like domain-containing protein n=1 Tax=Hohenbuehelia grisea TaxID=104357 RepID=A0ABR3JY54_9AGAR
MALLTRPEQYNIKDSNIALLGSDIEKRVREHAGDHESAWDGAGVEPGLQIWRIEQFNVVAWPKDRNGSFYDGDSYIVLNTYKKTPESESLSFDLHFWLGEHTTQDEAGTAAYKAVELDDHLHGRPVQYREVQAFESDRFLSYFPRFVCLQGGVATGFQHVSDAPPPDVRRLYRITLSPSRTLVVREVPAEGKSLVQGDVFVLDKGSAVSQLNTQKSAGIEKFKAAEFVQSLVSERQGQCNVTVYDEGGTGVGVFLAEFGDDIVSLPQEESADETTTVPVLYRLSDASGQLTFESVAPPALSSLASDDAFLLDDTRHPVHAAVYVWIGKGASLNERRLAGQYAQRFLYDHHGAEQVSVPIIRMAEGDETSAFVKALGG